MRGDVVGRKVTRAAAWLDDAAPILVGPVDAFLQDRAGRDLATFYVFLAVQECIDLAAHWLSDAGWPVPDESAALFDTLADRGALPADVAAGMRAAVGVRNRIAHGYAGVDHSRFHAEAQRGLSTLRLFLALVARPPAP